MKELKSIIATTCVEGEILHILGRKFICCRKRKLEQKSEKN